MKMASSFNLFNENSSEAKKQRIKSILDFKQKRQMRSANEMMTLQQQGNENLDDLLVFGYGCKLFRDDETALKLENEANLIPWNGDSSLLIDRYDCRGYLFDLKPYDSDYAKNTIKSDQVNHEEVEIENLCDEERYLDLNKQIELDSMYQEEELKRFYAEQSEYGAVHLNYSTHDGEKSKENVDTAVNEVKKQPQQILEVFVPSEKLKLPVGMLIPETKKQNKIIEKTANFVASKGLQMEILIKAKQSSNSLFNFLNYDNHLNSYYKHLIEMIKSGKYAPSNVDSASDQSESDSDDDGNYLHPLLSKNINNKETTSSQFKPNIKDSPYNELIEKFATHAAKFQKQAPNSPPSIVNSKDSPTTNVPSDEALKTMIDKLADYVARNGIEFEECIKRKNDQRFNFLNDSDSNYSYYRFKVKEFQALRNGEQENISKNSNITHGKSNSNNTRKDSDDNNSDIVDDSSPLNSERFTNEQKAQRKLKAALFLNMLNQQEDTPATKLEETNNKPIVSRSYSNSTRSRSRSRSRSSSHLKNKTISTRRSRSRTRSRSRKRSHRHRSHSSKSRKSKSSKHRSRSRHRSGRKSSRHRYSRRRHRSRSHSRQKSSKVHKKSRRKTRSRSRSRRQRSRSSRSSTRSNSRK